MVCDAVEEREELVGGGRGEVEVEEVAQEVFEHGACCGGVAIVVGWVSRCNAGGGKGSKKYGEVQCAG